MALHRSVSTVRNLLPSAFKLASDPDADIKARWIAFDKVYGLVVEDMANKGTPHKPTPFNTEGLTAEKVRTMNGRSMRYAVAAMLLTISYGTAADALPAVMWQAEALVPSIPDSETWHMPLTGQDQVVLFGAVRTVAELMPDDLQCFFNIASEPVARRRQAFRGLYACIGGVWREHSEFARALTAEQRQGMVVFALMCYVPRDQWTNADFVALHNELLPVEEPDWDMLSRRVGPS
ncbi:MAG: hypothetical protein WD716_12795 [Fimbriimonadaceae bacterium]